MSNINPDGLGLDRTLLDLSSKMAEPFCKAYDLIYFRLFAPMNPGQFDQCTNKTREIAVRTIIACGLVAAAAATVLSPLLALGSILVWGAACKALRYAGNALQKDKYTHVLGNAPEKSLDPLKAAVQCWNICGPGGGMAKDHGGVNDWHYRIEAIVQKILSEDPDVLVLEEIYDTALAEAIIARLKDHYAHFFIHLGPNGMGSESGLMVLSKTAVHDFGFTSFDTNDWTLNRGVATIVIQAAPGAVHPFFGIAGTHLSYRPEEGHLRAQQIAQIIDVAAKIALRLGQPIDFLLMGDLNFDSRKEMESFASTLEYGYLGTEPTITNALKNNWYKQVVEERDEVIDQIAIIKQPGITPQIEIADCRLSRSFDATLNSNTALSDHHALVATIQAKKPVEQTTDRQNLSDLALSQ